MKKYTIFYKATPPRTGLEMFKKTTILGYNDFMSCFKSETGANVDTIDSVFVEDVSSDSLIEFLDKNPADTKEPQKVVYTDEQKAEMQHEADLHEWQQRYI